MMYVPTVMLYFVGVSVFVLGPSHQGLAENKAFALTASVALLALLTILNIVGLGVGKWLNNLGGIGTGIAAVTLIGLGLVIWLRFGSTVSATEFHIPADPKFVLNSFGVRSKAYAARSGGLGRSHFWLVIHRCHSDVVDCSQQK